MAFINKNEEAVDLIGGVKSGSRGGSELQKRGPDQLFYAETKGFAKSIINLSGGLIKNEKQAEYAMISLIIAGFIVVFFIFFGGRTKQEFFTPAAEAPLEEVVAPAEF
ncbi:MAG: hypothetical protein Q8O83_03075 [bacterium]|nr:hypothetical protein [bacterium]